MRPNDLKRLSTYEITLPDGEKLSGTYKSVDPERLMMFFETSPGKGKWVNEELINHAEDVKEVILDPA